MLGRCLCAAVELHIEPPVRELILCHCIECRRWHGAAPAYLAVARHRLRVTGPLAWFDRDGWPRRGFCCRCGSSLVWDDPTRDTVGVVAGALEQPSGLRVIAEIYTDDITDYDRDRLHAGAAVQRHPGPGD